jgi:glycyl-tRNA synthetase (class II)
MSSGKKRLKWHLSLGLGKENYRFHDHEKLAHYANAADIEFNFPLIQRIRRDSLVLILI